MKILNLYAGIGGNRKLWDGHEVTAVEIEPKIATIYNDFYPKDTLIVGDAHEYLLGHYKEFDFIWSSPPCPSHSKARKMGVKNCQYPALYPDIKLWEEVILLTHFAKCDWVVENVKPYYEPIISPTFKLDRHYFWANFSAPKKEFKSRETPHNNINSGNHKIYGFDISGYDAPRKSKLLRNMVPPEVGIYILNCAKAKKCGIASFINS